MLLERHRSVGLSEDEMAEMTGILELNKILSFVNTKLATELWQSAPLSDNWLESTIFNPRLQAWASHFIWSADGLRVLGTTIIGRATCRRLDFNDAFHDDGFIVRSRSLWVSVGWHPPKDDPQITEPNT